MSLDSLHATSFMPLQSDEVFNINLPEMPIEDEVKFLVPDLKEIRDSIGFKELETWTLETSYLSKNLIPYALAYIIRHSEEDLSDLTPAIFNQARLRRAVPSENVPEGAKEKFFLEVKGPREIMSSRSQRGETGVELDASTFYSMLRFVRNNDTYIEEGFLVKKRRIENAFTEDGKKIVLEIDRIKAAGVGENFKKYKKNDWEFLQVGCESLGESAFEDLKRGRHTADFLKRSDVVFVTGNIELEKALSMRGTAKNGIKKQKIDKLLADLRNPELVEAA